MSHEIASPRVLEILEWPHILTRLNSFCKTTRGKKFCSEISPLDENGSRERLAKISALKNLFITESAPDLSGLEDVEKQSVICAKGGSIGLEELARVKSFASASVRIKGFLAERIDLLQQMSAEIESIIPLEGLSRLLSDSITDENELSEKKYPSLRKIKNEIREARKDVEKLISRMMNSQEMENSVQEKVFSERNGRYVLLIKSGSKGKVRGTVHDVSSSGSTLYIEPDEVIPHNNRITVLERELSFESARIIGELCGAVGDESESIIFNTEILALVDFLCASAHLSIALRGTEPEIIDRPAVRLFSVRHPVLYMLSPSTVVSNDIELGMEHSCLIVTGANTGGKTVMMKTVGLAILMALHGLHVPCGPDSQIGLFGKIFADIGDDQNISQSLSTFSGQLAYIKEMIENADDRSIVLIDEIIVGTNPRQGETLAQSILENMIESGAKMIVTTHYTQLKDLAAKDPRFQNGSVSFDLETLKPTYNFRTGIPGVSYALEIAKTCGLSDKIISRAKQLLDANEISIEALIEKIQKNEQELSLEREKIESLKVEIEMERRTLKEKLRRVTLREEEIKRSEGIKFLDEIREHRKAVSEKIKTLQKGDTKEAGRISDDLKAIQESVLKKTKDSESEIALSKYEPADIEKLGPGDLVYIAPLEKEGKIESINTEKKSAQILFGGSIKATFKEDDIYIDTNRKTAKKNIKPLKKISECISEDKIPLTVQTSFNTIDIRGKRVDDGLKTMEEAFDRMSRSGIHTVIIIHGHGTGAMKEAVRKNIAHSYYVENFRSGEMGEGGDGVTIVNLKW